MLQGCSSMAYGFGDTCWLLLQDTHPRLFMQCELVVTLASVPYPKLKVSYVREIYSWLPDKPHLKYSSRFF